MKGSMRLFAVWLTSVVMTAPLSAAPTTEVISLGYSMAETLIPVVEPMLQGEERVSGYGNQLIIRAEPERLEEIRSLIATLDEQPAKLRISIANSGNSVDSDQGYSVDGRLSQGPVDVIIGDPRSGNQTRIIRRATRGATDGVRQVTANEGYPVLIQSGQSVPITTTSTDAYGQVIRDVQYRDVTQGFYATVRINGDMATITLSANNDSINQSDSRLINIQRTDTVVTARLGEWVTIGALDDTAAAQDRDIGRRISTRSQDQNSIRLKVDRLE
ncbi:MAG TPA: secretin [Pseudomonas xinjiangensis]|uniref:Secretin n=2 Tax=root TaxID=1 RepID=A0A7V1BMD0_9GAMM|nr:secretin [Halopseudomonas xinjiangensis]HEC47733.1 secretin [Halopseudomonas xinjiangensis]